MAYTERMNANRLNRETAHRRRPEEPLLEALPEIEIIPCKFCAGTGKDFVRPGARPCQKCDGRGSLAIIKLRIRQAVAEFSQAGVPPKATGLSSRLAG